MMMDPPFAAAEPRTMNDVSRITEKDRGPLVSFFNLKQLWYYTSTGLALGGAGEGQKAV
jgi:hypothetical protein